jgi:polysaccharide export outer membrane protein
MVPLGPHDLIQVNIYGNPELSRSVRIAADGTVRMPMLEDAIRAAGKLPAEVEAAISAAFRTEQVLVDPIVSVTVAEYASRQVTIGGAVRNPTTVQALGNMRLAEAITRAGGLSSDAGAEILVREAGSKDPGSIRHVSVKQLIDESNTDVNVILNGGEEIMVPQAPHIFVVGNVQRPGTFPVTDSSGSSILKAIALTQGLAPYASKQAFILRLSPGTSERVEVPVDLSRIMERKSPDVPLIADDVLYIPDNKTKRVSAGVIDRLVGFGSATTSGVLIWRR